MTVWFRARRFAIRVFLLEITLPPLIMSPQVWQASQGRAVGRQSGAQGVRQAEGGGGPALGGRDPAEAGTGEVRAAESLSIRQKPPARKLANALIKRTGESGEILGKRSGVN